jgi:hypothetical protein
MAVSRLERLGVIGKGGVKGNTRIPMGRIPSGIGDIPIPDRKRTVAGLPESFGTSFSESPSESSGTSSTTTESSGTDRWFRERSG